MSFTEDEEGANKTKPNQTQHKPYQQQQQQSKAVRPQHRIRLRGQERSSRDRKGPELTDT